MAILDILTPREILDQSSFQPGYRQGKTEQPITAAAINLSRSISKGLKTSRREEFLNGLEKLVAENKDDKSALDSLIVTISHLILYYADDESADWNVFEDSSSPEGKLAWRICNSLIVFFANSGASKKNLKAEILFLQQLSDKAKQYINSRE